MSTTMIVLLVIVVLLGLYLITLYNGLVTLRNRFRNGFAQIDVQLKRRYDLIPNLVETAKGYLKHERETLEAVIQARNAAASAEKKVAEAPEDPSAVKGLMGAETTLRGAMGRFFALSEAYPDLKANQNMMQLTEELTTTENKISFARQAFNDAVMQYNIAREKFPAVFFAPSLGFKPAQPFEIEDQQERENIKVQFT